MKRKQWALGAMVLGVVLAGLAREGRLGDAVAIDVHLSQAEQRVSTITSEVKAPHIPEPAGLQPATCTVACAPAGTVCDAVLEASGCAPDDHEPGLRVRHTDAFCYVPLLKEHTVHVTVESDAKTVDTPLLDSDITVERSEWGLQSCRSFREGVGQGIGAELKKLLVARADRT